MIVLLVIIMKHLKILNSEKLINLFICKDESTNDVAQKFLRQEEKKAYAYVLM